jgi:hypothetical protein
MQQQGKGKENTWYRNNIKKSKLLKTFLQILQIQRHLTALLRPSHVCPSPPLHLCVCTALLKAEFFINPRRTHSGKEDEEKEE